MTGADGKTYEMLCIPVERLQIWLATVNANKVRADFRDEMLSLTDMWKASGSDPQQTPAKWRALPATKSFVDHVTLTIGKSDSDLFVTQNGGRKSGTFAHWQVGLAYAKYLSPEFHMWCANHSVCFGVSASGILAPS